MKLGAQNSILIHQSSFNLTRGTVLERNKEYLKVSRTRVIILLKILNL